MVNAIQKFFFFMQKDPDKTSFEYSKGYYYKDTASGFM